MAKIIWYFEMKLYASSYCCVDLIFRCCGDWPYNCFRQLQQSPFTCQTFYWASHWAVLHHFFSSVSRFFSMHQSSTVLWWKERLPWWIWWELCENMSLHKWVCRYWPYGSDSETLLLFCCFSVWYNKHCSPQLIFSAMTVGAVSPRVWFVTVTLIVTMAQMRSTVRANLLPQPWSVALGQSRVMMAQSVFYIAMCVTERETVWMDRMNKAAQKHADKVSFQGHLPPRLLEISIWRGASIQIVKPVFLYFRHRWV